MNEVFVNVPTANVDVEVIRAAIDVEPKQIDVHVDVTGLPGPPGPPGPRGLPGTGGGSGVRYTHTQAMPSPTWVIDHYLGCHPSVDAEDGAGNVIYGSVTHLSNDTLIVGFAYSITGKANCL